MVIDADPTSPARKELPLVSTLPTTPLSTTSKSTEQALGRISSGLYILTLGQGPQATGMLASWVQQCSFDPPALSVAIGCNRPILSQLTPGAKVVVNILGEGQRDYVAHFGKGVEPGDSAFAGLPVTLNSSGLPVLTGTLAHLECVVESQTQAGDHVLLVLRVIGGAVHHDGKPAYHSRKSGMHY
jgi:flavin reductase (DIM6/NTAB) family NADH-FMN oxidoreductase RutF